MRKTFFALTAVALLAGACSRKSGGGVKLKADTDSVAYIIGMNVGMNLLKMDSTLTSTPFARVSATYSVPGRSSRRTMPSSITFVT